MKRMLLTCCALLAACGSAPGDPEGARPISEADLAGATFYLNDPAGTPLVATDIDGRIVREESHHPYGAPRVATAGAVPGEPSFIGRERDTATGLLHLGARPYDAESGRFLAPDPVAVFEPERILEQPFRGFAYAYSAADTC